MNALPARLHSYLVEHGAQGELCAHAPTATSPAAARAAGIAAHALAKAVVLEDDDGCLLALVPADRYVRVGRLSQLLDRPRLRLAVEDRLAALFPDCERGAVPTVGMAWNLPTVVDEELEQAQTVYLACGDHEHLLRMPHELFRALMHEVPHGSFCADRLH